MLKKSQRLLFALVSLALSSTLASAQPAEVVRNEITLRGTVEAVDHASRTVRIRGEQGNVVTLDVPQSVARFDQVKVGDLITASYFDVVSVRPKPAGEAAVDRSIPPITSPTPEHPAWRRQGIAACDDGHHHGLGSRDARGDVHGTGRDQLHASSAGTGRQPHGGAQGGRPRRRHPDRVGDLFVSETPRWCRRLRRRRTRADDFRHRLTISVLFGVDNSFCWKHDQGGNRVDDRGRADQPERDEIRRCVRPHGDVQVWRRLSRDTAH